MVALTRERLHEQAIYALAIWRQFDQAARVASCCGDLGSSDADACATVALECAGMDVFEPRPMSVDPVRVLAGEEPARNLEGTRRADDRSVPILREHRGCGLVSPRLGDLEIHPGIRRQVQPQILAPSERLPAEQSPEPGRERAETGVALEGAWVGQATEASSSRVTLHSRLATRYVNSKRP